VVELYSTTTAGPRKRAPGANRSRLYSGVVRHRPSNQTAFCLTSARPGGFPVPAFPFAVSRFGFAGSNLGFGVGIVSRTRKLTTSRAWPGWAWP
jgi:hypothetical protein